MPQLRLPELWQPETVIKEPRSLLTVVRLGAANNRVGPRDIK